MTGYGILVLIVFAIGHQGVTLASRSTCRPTMADIEGPYYMEGAPFRNSSILCNLTGGDNGTNLIIKGRVTDEDCRTGVEALLDIWQANSAGAYALSPGDYTCRGKMMTDPKGYFVVHTVLPGWYLEGGGYRPAHIHWKISRSSHPQDILTTQLYFQHDPYLADKDPCSSFCHSGDSTITVPIQRGLAKKNDTVVVLWGIVLRQAQKGNRA